MLQMSISNDEYRKQATGVTMKSHNLEHFFVLTLFGAH